MPRIEADIPPQLAREIDRIIRDGWYGDSAEVVEAALAAFVEGRTFLGDSPRMLLRFAADALNESRPEVALRFADRGISRLLETERYDRNLYQQLIELRIQLLLIVGRQSDALATIEEARERLPNNPGIQRWAERLANSGSR